MLPRAMTLLSFLLDFLSSNVKCMYKSVFKITHLSPVINCTLQWKEKCIPVEHVFCLQTRTGGMVYCVHSRVKQCRPELPHRLKFKESSAGVTIRKEDLMGQLQPDERQHKTVTWVTHRLGMNSSVIVILFRKSVRNFKIRKNKAATHPGPDMLLTEMCWWRILGDTGFPSLIMGLQLLSWGL